MEAAAAETEVAGCIQTAPKSRQITEVAVARSNSTNHKEAAQSAMHGKKGTTTRDGRLKRKASMQPTQTQGQPMVRSLTKAVPKDSESAAVNDIFRRLSYMRKAAAVWKSSRGGPPSPPATPRRPPRPPVPGTPKWPLPPPAPAAPKRPLLLSAPVVPSRPSLPPVEDKEMKQAWELRRQMRQNYMRQKQKQGITPAPVPAAIELRKKSPSAIGLKQGQKLMISTQVSPATSDTT